MGDTAADLYVAAFRARCDAYRRPGRPEVDAPGVHGLLAGAEDSLARLLITDDRAYDLLEVLLPRVEAAIITAFAAATRCVELIAAHLGGRVTTPTAMVCRDLGAVPVILLPEDLTLRPVCRQPGDAPDGVPLRDAAAAAMRADPTIREDLAAFAGYLRSLPSAFQLFAALDPSGVVRATAGSGAFGIYGSVIFVDTDPGWRGRGVGTGMTSAALHAARDAGATRACLDAGDAAVGIYRKLGFEAVGPVTRFYRPG